MLDIGNRAQMVSHTISYVCIVFSPMCVLGTKLS